MTATLVSVYLPVEAIADGAQDYSIKLWDGVNPVDFNGHAIVFQTITHLSVDYNSPLMVTDATIDLDFTKTYFVEVFKNVDLLTTGWLNLTNSSIVDFPLSVAAVPKYGDTIQRAKVSATTAQLRETVTKVTS